MRDRFEPSEDPVLRRQRHASVGRALGGWRGSWRRGLHRGTRSSGFYFGTPVGCWPFVGGWLWARLRCSSTRTCSRAGSGELFAGLGLGPLPVVGTALVQRGTIGPAAWAAGVPAFLMTFNLLLLNEFPDEKADRAGGRRNLVLVFGRRGAALIYIAAAVATPVAIVVAVLARWLPPLALLGALPFWFAIPAVRWAASRSHEAVPIHALTGNVIWNLATNSMLAVGLGLAAYLGWVGVCHPGAEALGLLQGFGPGEGAVGRQLFERGGVGLGVLSGQHPREQSHARAEHVPLPAHAHGVDVALEFPRPPDDRRTVGRHRVESAPRPAHLDVGQLRHQLDHAARDHRQKRRRLATIGSDDGRFRRDAEDDCPGLCW